jgi:hypothetical protein
VSLVLRGKDLTAKYAKDAKEEAKKRNFKKVHPSKLMT